MIKTLLILLLPLQLFARQIYVSESGSDAAAGTSQATSWATISKVNTSSISGDTVNFNKGDTWYGTIIPASSSITFISYGAGANPVITGFTSVVVWTNLGGNIWEGTVSGGLATCNMVSINGVNTAMGRYPNFGSANDGYLVGQSGSNTTTIVNSTLTGTPNWTGAEILIRHQDWSSNRGTITGQATTTLTYSSTSSYAFSVNHGFFIQNAAATLDVQNEWYYYDASGTKKIQIYSTTSPTNVKVATLTTLVDMTYTSGTAKTGISFTGIDFVGSNGTLFKNFYANYTTVDSCNLSFAGISGIEYGNTTSHLTVQNSSIADCAMVGIYETYFTNVDNVLIQNNTLQRIGINAGMTAPISTLYDGGNGSIGIIGGSLNYTVYNNYLDSIGYNGIGLRQNRNNTLVRKNQVKNWCLVKNDGGGIYNGGQRGLSPATNVVIDSNLVYNSGNASAGTGITFPHARAIYLDFTSDSVSVFNNTIFSSSEGIYLSGARKCIVRNNLIVGLDSSNNPSYGGSNVPWYAGMLSEANSNGVPNTRANTITQNVIYAAASTQVFLNIYDTYFEMDSIGVLDSNFYYNPGSSSKTHQISGSANTQYTYAAWKTAHPLYDMSSIYSTTSGTFYYNSTKANKAIFFTSLSKKDGKGNVYNNNLILAPNAGILLFANGAAPPPATTNTMPLKWQ